MRTRGLNQGDDEAASYVRWVMVNKRDANSPAPDIRIPELPDAVDPKALAFPRSYTGWDNGLAGSALRYDAYEIGEKSNHVVGMTVVAAAHQIAARLFPTTAKGDLDCPVQ